MIHSFLLVVAAYLVVLGIIICAFLFAATIKGRKGIWLITLPGIFIVAVLGIRLCLPCDALAASSYPLPKACSKCNSLDTRRGIGPSFTDKAA